MTETPPPGAPGMPDVLPTPEGERPEALRRRAELYTVEGDVEIIAFDEALESGDVRAIQQRTEEAIAFMDGLFWGVEADNYGLNNYKEDDRGAIEAKTLFESVEGSLDKPQFTHVFLKVRNGLVRAEKLARSYKRDPEEWQTRYQQERVLYWRTENRTRVIMGELPMSQADIDQTIQKEVNYEQGKLERWHRSIPDLKGLKDHLDARFLFDEVFSLTQRTCEDEIAWLESARSMKKPDKGHWMALYRGNMIKAGAEREEDREKISRFGDVLSKTIDAMGDGVREGRVKILDEDGNELEDAHEIYVRGFRTTAEFVAWAKALLPYTKLTDDGEERMDVLFLAWKQNLLTGNISRLAWRAKQKKDVNGNMMYVYDFGPPPLASDIMTKVIHNEKLRAKEWGWPANNAQDQIVDLDSWELKNLDGSVIRGMKEADYEKYVRYAEKHRTKPYKAASHSGHPLSIGRIGKLVDEWESHAEIDKWINPKTGRPYGKISLRSIAVDHGISRADLDFPWADTEIRKPGDPVGEVAPGSFGGWHLNKIRGHIIRVNHVRNIPPPGELRLDNFGDPKVRMWEKLGKLNPGRLTRGGLPQNEFAWWLSGVLRARSRNDKSLYSYKGSDRDYRSRSKQNKIFQKDAGATPDGVIADGDILDDAFEIGAISYEELVWILENIVPRRR